MTPNLIAPTRGFPQAEFEQRCIRAQRLMAAKGLDGLLLTTEPEFRYYTGFLTRFWLSPTRPWFLILPASGKPIAVVPSIGESCLKQTWIDDIRCWSSPCPEDEGVSLLAASIQDTIGSNARIGMPEGPETHLRMPLLDYCKLLASLPKVTFEDATDIIQDLRMIKSPAEIAKITHICHVVGSVFEALPDFTHAGMSEINIFKKFKIACLEAGADDVDYLVGGSGPGGYGDVISPPSTRELQSGDLLMLDTGTTFDGYFCDFDRNYAIGVASANSMAAYDVLFEATDAGFSAAKSGALCSDVYGAMNDVIQTGTQRIFGKNNDLNTGDMGRMGHGLGMQLTEWPSFTAKDRTRLHPGMVLTLEPIISLSGANIMVHEENILITADGPKYLTCRAPSSLPIIRG